MKTLAIVLILSLCGLIACSPAAPDQNQAKQEIRKTWDQFIEAWEAEDARSCSEFYVPDAVNIPPNANTLKGREAIAEFYEFLFSNNQRADYTHTMENLEVGHNLAVEGGNFKVDWVRNDSSSWTFKARTLTHWQKSAEGKWLIKQFMFNLAPEDG